MIFLRMKLHLHYTGMVIINEHIITSVLTGSRVPYLGSQEGVGLTFRLRPIYSLILSLKVLAWFLNFF